MEYWTIGLVTLVIGLILLLVEVLTPGQTFMAIPGTVAIFLGCVMMALGPWLFSEIWYAPAIAALVALPVTAITVWGYLKLGKGHPPIPTSIDSLLGRQGTVMQAVVPDTFKGQVKIGTELWSATADTEIPAGTRVEVVDAQGIHVHVERVASIVKLEKEMKGKEERKVM